MAKGTDPRSARIQAMANIQKARDSKVAALIPAAAALLSARLKAESQENAAALEGRISVRAADQAAAQAAAEQQAAEQEGAGQPDITQFFPSTPVNAQQPGGAPSFADLMAGAGGSANALANRAVAPARQQAGTLPSAAPPQYAQGGGGGGMSVDVGGQQFSAPDTITNMRQTTGPLQFDPGLFTQATTTTVDTRQNVLTPGDLLSAKMQYDNAQAARMQQAGQFLMSHALQTEEARGRTIAGLIQQGIPPPVAIPAGGAILDGQDGIASKMLQGYDTTGQAQIAAERQRASLYAAKQQEVEQKLNLSPMALYQVGPFLGLGQTEVPPTGSAALETERSIRKSLAEIYGGNGVSFDFGFAKKGATDATRASAVMAAGREAGRLNSVLTFERTSDDSDEYVLDFSNPQEIMALYHLASGNAQGFPASVKQQAARILESKGLGAVDEAGNLDPSQAPPVLQPWARKVREAYETHRGAPDYAVDPKDPGKRLTFPDAVLDKVGNILLTKYPELFAPPPKVR